MPIFVKESPEPFTFRSVASPPILAECEAYRSLLASILRYGRREIMGRSVLISGHRGSGKTTLVRWAVLQAEKQLSGDPTAARPLLVPLHGPDLLGGEAVLATVHDPPAEPKAARKHPLAPPEPEQAPGEAEQKDRDTRAALRMLAQALHRAYVTELGRALAEQTAGDKSLHELAAQLIVELDHAPDLDALRFVWQRAGKLQSGVLFPATTPPLRDDRQGYRELLAASAVIEGYRRVAGKLEGVDGSSRQSEFSEKAERKSDWSGKDFLNPVAGLLAGAAAGAGILSSGGNGALTPLAAAFTGILTAVGSTAALNYSSVRSRQTTRQSKLTFTWDTSIASLDRMLPVMVSRIVEAGLAPIFVVDELDKIDGIENKIEGLIHHLKHLVSEKTFFCFLTDRSYFEHLVASSRRKIYGKEYTFFSDRLFVHYSPRDMHKYLFDILTRDNLTDNEQLDRSVLPHLLLERSKMHPIDVRRAISNITDQKSAITLPVGDVRKPEGYGMSVLMQTAVEVVLDQPDLRSRLSQDPNFGRIAHDALYLPARSWENGDDVLDLRRESLRSSLEARMADEDDAESTQSNLSEADLDLLYASLLRVVDFLRKPETLVQELSKPAVAEPAEYGDEYKTYKEAQRNAVRQVIPVTELLLDETGTEESRWLRDPFGRLRAPHASAVVKAVAAAGVAGVMAVPEAPAVAPSGPPSGADAPVPTFPTRERIRQIRALNDFIRWISGQRLDLDKLATRIHLLSISPAWPSVESAILRFESAGSPASTADATLLSSQSLIESYARGFDAAYGPIRRALIIGTLMALTGSGSNLPRLLERALELLAADLQFAKMDIQAASDRLRTLDKETREMAVNLGFPVDDILAVPEWDLQTWAGGLHIWMETAFTRRPTPTLAVPGDRHDLRWRDFFFSHLRGGPSRFVPVLEDLLLRASGGALPLPTDWDEVTYLDIARTMQMLGHLTSGAPLLLEAILVELGFGQAVAGMLPRSDVSAETLELLEICHLPSVQRNGERVLLGVGGAVEQRANSADGDVLILMAQGAGSLVAGWRLSQAHSVIPVFTTALASPPPLFLAPYGKGMNLALIESLSPPLHLNLDAINPSLRIYWIEGPDSKAGPGILAAPASLDAAIGETQKWPPSPLHS